MKWIVIWWVISCTPCDSYFLTEGKEPCFEPKKIEHFEMFDDHIEASSFAATKKMDGGEAQTYCLISDGRLEVLKRRQLLSLLKRFYEVADEEMERIGVRPEEILVLQDFIDALEEGKIELLSYGNEGRPDGKR